MTPDRDPLVASLREALEDHREVLAAYLFGSAARGEAGPLSDVDVGLFLDPGLDDDERFDRRLQLVGVVSEAVGSDDVDVVVLQDVPPRLAHEAFKGERFLVRDRDAVVDFEVGVTSTVLDRRPYDERYDELYLERASS